MAYATGKYMRYPRIGHSYHVEDVVGMVRLNFKGRVEMHEGQIEIAPGIVLYPTPGHSDGLQIARVHTKRGWVVLASDATHYYENIEQRRPFPIVFDVDTMVAGYSRIEQLASGPDMYIPGHDPEVFERYDPVSHELEGIAARLA
jgi:glyoxylase-like metal-dependent hydrolase (beta-lactamase superfamily II)